MNSFAFYVKAAFRTSSLWLRLLPLKSRVSIRVWKLDLEWFKCISLSYQLNNRETISNDPTLILKNVQKYRVWLSFFGFFKLLRFQKVQIWQGFFLTVLFTVSPKVTADLSNLNNFKRMNSMMKRCFKLSKQRGLFRGSKLFKMPTEEKCLLMIFNDDYFWTK